MMVVVVRHKPHPSASPYPDPLGVCRYKLVKEALRERRWFLNTAPHLSSWLPIMVPLQKWWQAPYFWAGCKAYDLLAGSEGIESSYFLTKSKAIDSFPMLKRDNVVGAMVYYGKLFRPRSWESEYDENWKKQY